MSRTESLALGRVLTVICAVGCAAACAEGESLYTPPDLNANAGGTGGAAGGSTGKGGDTATGGGGSTGTAGTGGMYIPPIAGTGGGGSGGGGSGGGGSGGTGGGSGGGGSGGGGSGGGGSGGKAGTGGMPPVGNGDCDDKASWTATSSSEDPPDPVENVIDGDDATLFQTGAVQAATTWLQIDFGGEVDISAVNILSTGAYAGDYPRGWAATLSNTPNNTAGTPDVTGAGAAGNPNNTVIDFGETLTGRYLLIELTMDSGGPWWSAHELTVTCE